MKTPTGLDVYTANFNGHTGPGIFVTDSTAGDVFTYNDAPPANQAPFQVLGGPASTLSCPSDVRVSRSTKFIYVTDPCTSRINAFRNIAPFNFPPFLWYAGSGIQNPLGIWLNDRN